jgi:integrase
MSTKSRLQRVKALALRPGSPGEAAAAEAALTRLSAPVETLAESGAVRLSDTLVKHLPTPARGNKITVDNVVAGFGCRATAAGSKSYVYTYRVKSTGQQRQKTIGPAASWSASAARDEAKRLRRIVDGGGDPLGEDEEERTAATAADLIKRFEADYLPRKRASTARSYRGMLKKHIGPHFGKYTKVADIKFADIDELHRKVTDSGSTYVANRCIALCSKMFSLAIKWEMRTDNPCKGVERNAESKRRRYLSADELKRLTAAMVKTPDRQFVNIVSLLMLTGARKGEVLSMRREQLDLTGGIWTKPGATTKQRTDHIVPLSTEALAVLKSIIIKSGYMFPAGDGHVPDIEKPWKRLCDRAEIQNLRIHDLRHSFASFLASNGMGLPLIGALLGHTTPSTTARYSHLFDEVQRAAVAKVGSIIGSTGGDSNA